MNEMWIPVSVTVGQNIITKYPQVVTNSLNVPFGNREYILPLELSIYKTADVPINPNYPPQFKFIFEIKADSHHNTHYTVFVGVRNGRHEPIPHPRWLPKLKDDPMWEIFQDANYYVPKSNQYERRKFDYRPKKGDLPNEARFIAFFILTNHKRTSTQYRLSDYVLQVNYNE